MSAVRGNPKLMEMVFELFQLIRDGKYFEAIDLNEKITKMLDTYRDAC